MLHKVAVERDEYARAEFAVSLAEDFSGTGNEFVVIDESCKNEHEILRRYGRSHTGQQADYSEVFVRGERYSMIAALTIEGYIAVEVTNGSFDGELFLEYLVEKVVCLVLSISAHHSPFR